MAETTFRFIYDSVAATTASDSSGAPSGGSSSSEKSPEGVQTGSPSRINNIMKQSTKSVQEGIKGGLKSLGIALTLGNLLKQSQVFTSSLNALFQIVGAFFDILLAPLMPYFAKWLRRGAPKLLEWAEKMAKWVENLFLEIGSAESFGTWIGEKVADGLLKGVKKALGFDVEDEKPPSRIGDDAGYDPSTLQQMVNPGGGAKTRKGGNVVAQNTALESIAKFTLFNTVPGLKGANTLTGGAISRTFDNVLGGGGLPEEPWAKPGSGQGGFLGTGAFSEGDTIGDFMNEAGEFLGRMNPFKGKDQLDIVNQKHDQEHANRVRQNWHFDNRVGMQSWGDG